MEPGDCPPLNINAMRAISVTSFLKVLQSFRFKVKCLTNTDKTCPATKMQILNIRFPNKHCNVRQATQVGMRFLSDDYKDVGQKQYI